MARRTTRSITKKVLNDENNGEISAHLKNNGPDDQLTELDRNAEKIAQLIVEKLAQHHNIHLCKVVADDTSVQIMTKSSSTSKERDSDVTNKSERRHSLRSSARQSLAKTTSASKEHLIMTNKSERQKSLRNGHGNEESIPGESIRRITRATSEGRVFHTSQQRRADTPVSSRRNLRSSSTFQRSEYICSRCKTSWKHIDSKISNYVFERTDYHKDNEFL